MNCKTVQTFHKGKELKLRGGKLALPFDGNRVDVVLKDGAPAQVRIKIDGKRPSEIPELYGFTRALATPGGKWPVILRLSWEKPLQLEEWTLEAVKDAADPKQFSFKLSGLVTGPDGEGRSDRKFVSKSGRVVIDPQDWNVEYSLALPGIKPVPDRFVVRWKVVPYFKDEVSPNDSDGSTERAVTVAQGLSNGSHTLEILGEGAASVSAVRIYHPPVPAE